MHHRPMTVQFDRVRDVKGAVRVLSEMLPAEVVAGSGFGPDVMSDHAYRFAGLREEQSLPRT